VVGTNTRGSDGELYSGNVSNLSRLSRMGWCCVLSVFYLGGPHGQHMRNLRGHPSFNCDAIWRISECWIVLPEWKVFASPFGQ
jgi:hypothetical protein